MDNSVKLGHIKSSKLKGTIGVVTKEFVKNKKLYYSMQIENNEIIDIDSSKVEILPAITDQSQNTSTSNPLKRRKIAEITTSSSTTTISNLEMEEDSLK